MGANYVFLTEILGRIGFYFCLDSDKEFWQMFTEIVNLMNNNMREDVDFFPLAFIVIRRIENNFTDLKKILSLMTPFWRVILHLINRIKLIFFFCQNKNRKKIQTSEKNIQDLIWKNHIFFHYIKAGRPSSCVRPWCQWYFQLYCLLSTDQSLMIKKNSRVNYF